MDNLVPIGTDGHSGYLDYYDAHRMTNDRHVRIYADSRKEGLEAPRELLVYSEIADAESRHQAEREFRVHNSEAYEELRE